MNTLNFENCRSCWAKHMKPVRREEKEGEGRRRKEKGGKGRRRGGEGRKREEKGR